MGGMPYLRSGPGFLLRMSLLHKRPQFQFLFGRRGPLLEFADLRQQAPVQRRRYAVRWNRLLANRFFAALSEAFEDVYASIKRGRNGQGS